MTEDPVVLPFKRSLQKTGATLYCYPKKISAAGLLLVPLKQQSLTLLYQHME